jgi:hypothetical protein
VLVVTAPIFTVVAALAKFTVVAPVLSKSKLLEVVINEVSNVGEVCNTVLPVPVVVPKFADFNRLERVFDMCYP